MKSILIPTDFSQNANEALLYTVQTFGHVPRRFIVMYSYEDEFSTLNSRVNIGKSEKMADMISERAEEDGKVVLDWLNEQLGDHNHTIDFVSTGIPLYRAVNRIIEDQRVSLVAMGTKGRTAQENVLVGSTTVRMIERIKDCPLLVIPKGLQANPSRKVGFATDFEQFAALSEIEPLVDLIKHNHSSLDVLHVGSKESLNETQKTNYLVYEDDLKNLKAKFHFLERETNVSTSLQHFIDDAGIDFLVLIYRKHNVIMKLFREPVINQLGRKMSMPHLIIPK